ncbi:YciI family protein [Ralstonia pickettii]|uniref:YciI family protein n=1 Tax=Ralstonia pickettii TaxID=329 RepID=A0A7X2HN27_RALPI|nr:YciI family protein [Ralstonia pickettii]MRS99416.1 YciI family protein [Ralstonia pickettii]
MKHVILCKLKVDGATARKALRLKHLEYIDEHKSKILAGGPALSDDSAPWMMILFTNLTDRQEAEDFIRHEPYTASGQVFESVEVHPWSQVLPEPVAGSLQAEITRERE